MSNVQISLKSALVADLKIGSEVDGSPLIEHFVAKGRDYYDEWVSALSSDLIVVTDLVRLNGGQVEVYFNISPDPVILHKNDTVLVSV